MSQAVNAIASRLSLRPPQKTSLEILERLCELLTLQKETEVSAALQAVKSEFPDVADFERDFPSLCFALATGVGKTRLMGAFIAYLHKAKGVRHFFILAPNLTIHDKLIADFTPNTPKYVFQGLAEFASWPPQIITSDNYESGKGVRDEARGQITALGLDDVVHINIFNISKIIGAEGRKFRTLRESIGQSYFDYLSQLDDLVLLMDESHRYRALAGMKAIGELKPVLGLELTATPQVERGAKTEPFKNVIYAYPLSSAMEDGFVKEPAVATRENFDASGYDETALERLKLEDGASIHEETKNALKIYSAENEKPLVKPFMLIVAKDTGHADALLKIVEDASFLEGRYKGKAIVVHSNLKGEEKDETVTQLMHVEKPDNPTEIVIHVNMLKEGWDVANLYTIVPLRAANSKTLVEQSIGRGLRLPYGQRTGVSAVDRLTIVSHDKFQEIVDYANSPDSIIRGGIKVVYVPTEKTKTVLVPPLLTSRLIGVVDSMGGAVIMGDKPPLFHTKEEKAAVEATFLAIKELAGLSRSSDLKKKEVQASIVERVKEMTAPAQGELEGIGKTADIAKIVSETVSRHIELSIDIPRVSIQPVSAGIRDYKEFKLDLSHLRFDPVPHKILIQTLRTREQSRLVGEDGIAVEKQLEDYLVRGLVDFNDINYDAHAELLYGLAAQTVSHLRSYLKDEADVLNVIQYYQPKLVKLIYDQMQDHFEEKAAVYEAQVGRGFTTPRPKHYSIASHEKIRDFRTPVTDKNNIKKMIFGGFKKCLYPTVKFDSDPERRFAAILENDQEVLKWFQPSKDDIGIGYDGESSYEPDFIVEAAKTKFLCEIKRASEMKDETVLLKARAATQWCGYASKHALEHGAKPWAYLLIPDEAVAGNKTLRAFSSAYSFQAAGAL
jgi:type III restriction enzyme